MLVYVTAIIVVMVRQFRMLNSLEEDTNRLLVVNTKGNTEVESLRLVENIWRKIAHFYFIEFNSGLFSRIQRISFERKIKYIECNRNPFR